ncbi:NAD-dependent succinate-semialdehyde dehydrogenase [Candidatus Binatia bacterium]|nr:NAD-dependent succinate-semialdehyde dehydrogenase [Candidatus Binatia bacterium]
MAISSINPATGEVVRRFKAAPRAEIERALADADRAFRSWRERSIDERSRVLLRAAEVLRERKAAYARLVTLEMGKPIAQSEAEIEKCAEGCEYYAVEAARMLADEAVKIEGGKSLIVFQPLGVVLAVMPWNFPFWQVFRFAAPALMAGNVGILKHASNVPQCALAIDDVFRRSGSPRGVFRNLSIGAGAVSQLVADDRVAAVTLTGSELAGVEVAGAAGRHLKKVVLELGGADPFIVLNDADLGRAAAVAAQARTMNSGQSCIAAKRFIVERAVAAEFTARFVAAMAALRVGDPMDPATQVGPLARPDLVDEIDRQVRRSVRMGARVLTGGRRIGRVGNFYAPTVLDRVKSGMPAHDEEVFGPVGAVIVARNEADAVRIANASRFGLGGSVWGRDLDRCAHVARQLEVGTVYVNDFVRSDRRLPFGGVKKSGHGRELGVYGIKEFTNIKTMVAP